MTLPGWAAPYRGGEVVEVYPLAGYTPVGRYFT